MHACACVRVRVRVRVSSGLLGQLRLHAADAGAGLAAVLGQDRGARPYAANGLDLT
jgi:hypothetical protein